MTDIETEIEAIENDTKELFKAADRICFCLKLLAIFTTIVTALNAYIYYLEKVDPFIYVIMLGVLLYIYHEVYIRLSRMRVIKKELEIYKQSIYNSFEKEKKR